MIRYASSIYSNLKECLIVAFNSCLPIRLFFGAGILKELYY